MAIPEKLDENEVRFEIQANRLAKELAASFKEDRERVSVQELYEEYVKHGSPENIKNWLRPRIESIFQCVNRRPEWLEGESDWPFLNGKPMTFVQQFDVPEFQFPDGRTSSACT